LISIAAVIMVIGICEMADAELRIDLTPGISVSEQYDDNIYLAPSNEVSDYITRVTPSLRLGLTSQHTNFQAYYAPSFTWYQEDEAEDYVEHLATLAFSQDLTEHLRFSLTDNFIQSQDPLSDEMDTQGLRRERGEYWRNTGRAGLAYLFGPENRLSLGYSQSNLENDDPAEDDGNIRTPSAGLTYWFNVNNGVDLSYEYVIADFWRDDNGVAGDDYTGHNSAIRYIHRFSPHTSGWLRYAYSTRDFDGAEEDYDIHQGNIGYEHAFSPQTSLSLSAGYWKQILDISDNETGYAYDARFIQRFSRGSLTIGGAGGWDEAYLQADRRGLTRYVSGNARLDYQLLEPLFFFVGGSYRLDREETNREYENWRGNCGLRMTFLRWFSASLEYTFADRDDDIDTEDYTVNRVMLMLSASRLFRW
jgi:hypothetical protein